MSDASTRGPSAVGLPDQVRVCLFDLDGVLTRTAAVHATAWKDTFDAYLRQRADAGGETFREFDIRDDYNAHVDGKPRKDGVRDFLASRAVTLPEGQAQDGPDTATVEGVATPKNEMVLAELEEHGVTAYKGSLRYLAAVRAAGLRIAAVTASANAEAVLEAGGFAEFIEARIDGVVAEREHLKGKPAPDPFLAGARALGVEVSEAAVFEDALSGVQAGRAGKFGFVVGVNRVGQAQALLEHGADIVVDDLAELLQDGAHA